MATVASAVARADAAIEVQVPMAGLHEADMIKARRKIAQRF
jgi:uncharacterized protein YfaP (DUF2135 family)